MGVNDSADAQNDGNKDLDKENEEVIEGTGDGDAEGKGGEKNPAETDPAPKVEDEGVVKIPKDRFDKVVGQRNDEKKRSEALEARLRQVEERLQAASSQEYQQTVDALENQIEAAADAGDKTTERALRKRLDAIKEERILTVATAKAEENINKRLAAQSIATAVDYVSTNYPELDPNSDVFDKDKLDYAIYQRDKLIREGMPPAQAIKQAAAIVSGKKGAKIADSRQKRAAERGIEADLAQPKGSASSVTTTKLDIANMSEDEFKKLTKEQLAQIRGDHLR